MLALTVTFGLAAGVALGLTGGGGSIIAVPLLVYGLGLDARQAVGVSLAAIGTTSLVGALHRLRRGELEVRTGVIFAVAGMAGAPAGSLIARQLPEALLLVLFAALMLGVATMMWLKASTMALSATIALDPLAGPPEKPPTSACRYEPHGPLRLSSRCGLVLATAGVGTGILSGLFGVGGGFVIVPALVLVTGMAIHRAVATSMMIIALISVSGVFGNVLSGEPPLAGVTALFVLGGVIGLVLGTVVGRRMSPVTLQKVFAAVIVAVAVFVIFKNVA